MTNEIELWGERAGATRLMMQAAQKIDLDSTIDDGIDPSLSNMIEKILKAEDENAIFAAVNEGTIATKDYLNNPFLLKRADITWKKSAEVYRGEFGFPWYALTQVTDLTTGERVTLNGGGWKYVFALWRLIETGSFDKYEEEGGMPLVLTGRPTSAGYTVVLMNRYQLPKVMRDAPKSSKEVKSS